MRNVIRLVVLAFLAGGLLAGCQNPMDPDGLLAKWGKASQGIYEGPPVEYEQAPARPTRPGRGDNSHMYVGYGN